MKKRLFAILLAGLLTANICACNAALNKTQNTAEACSENNAYASNKYEPVLNAYKNMVADANSNKDINSSDYPELDAETFKWMSEYASQNSSFGKAYATKDLNADGVDELIILDGSNKKFCIHAIFTMVDEQITPVITSNNPDTVENIAISKDGRIYRAVTLKGESYYHEVIRLMSEGEKSVFAYSYEDYSDFDFGSPEIKRHKIIDGKQIEISAEELREIESEYADKFQNISKLTADTRVEINYLFEFDPK